MSLYICTSRNNVSRFSKSRRLMACVRYVLYRSVDYIIMTPQDVCSPFFILHQSINQFWFHAQLNLFNYLLYLLFSYSSRDHRHSVSRIKHNDAEEMVRSSWWASTVISGYSTRCAMLKLVAVCCLLLIPQLSSSAPTSPPPPKQQQGTTPQPR